MQMSKSQHSPKKLYMVNGCAADSFDPKYVCAVLIEKLLFISIISKNILS